MPIKLETTLDRMSNGQKGIIVNINGGQGLINRLSALGIMKGKRVTKVSNMIMHGPVTAEVGQTRIAMGHNMAGKVIVEVASP
ncbi:MAG: hypothetical protein A2283_18505 [Lentisphaerae bacterium RIFOXYA12_FULL_48_11]|nr:MAG: hypothetical protein A2283_18505 [Lentisphaerae bacterium RIFOXYA12_FULL_48_11]